MHDFPGSAGDFYHYSPTFFTREITPHNTLFDEKMSYYAIFLKQIAIFTRIYSKHIKNHILLMEENPNLNRIKVALVERQKTSKWLAEQMEKSDTTVSRWVSNKIQPSLEQLFEIARILNMDVKDLLNSNILK